MVDIDPTASVGKYAPRNTTLVDAVAEAKRIADQSLRSNPLENARISGGLTKWVGNYGGSLLWVGEISPNDQNLLDNYGNTRPQRGFVLQRDDPQQAFALLMYDPNPQEGVPLRQRLQMFDRTGKVTYKDSEIAGLAFPDRPIPMYARVNIEAGLTNGSDDIIWSGAGNITGTVLEFAGGWAAGGTVTVTAFIRVTGVGGTVVNSPTRVLSGANSMFEQIDISSIYNNGEDFVYVDWHMFRSAGTGNYYPRPDRVRNYSP